nr:trypsin-like peptidase domain-containing protein [uncultured Draconibacterium sp.]
MEINSILDIKQIEAITGTVDCKQVGTCFLVKKDIAVTARHVIEDDLDNNEIKVEFPNVNSGKINAKVVDEDINNDIAILQLDKSFDVQLFPLSINRVQREENWNAYGFPNTKRIAGHEAQGTISRENDDFQDWDIDIRTESDDIDSHQAMSGSALISKGKIVGVLIKEQEVNRTIYCVSTIKLKPFLQKNSIPIEEINSEIPPDLIEDIEGVEENYIAINRINEIIKKYQSGYYGVFGSPGAGKTTVAAQFYSDNDSYKILGKYFIKSKRRNPHIYGKLEEFAVWCNEILHKEIFNSLPAKQPLKDIIIGFGEKLQKLSESLKLKNEIGVIIIDGLDNIQNTEEFFSIFTNTVPDNILVIIFGTSTSPLPSYLEISDDRIYNLQPLNSHQCEIFIQAELNNQLNGVQQKELANKSEGHPLYLRYLVEYIKENSSQIDIDNWFEEIPIIGGNIENYYSQLWKGIEDTPSIIYLVSTLSQLRQAVVDVVLKQFMPPQYQLSFITDFKNIKHLVSIKDSAIYIYHSSFAEFIKAKTNHINGKDVHSSIVSYCISVPDDTFSISNLIYHQIQSNEPQNAINSCNQNWVDKSTKIHIKPSYLINDIKLVLEYAIDTGNVAEVIRIKLLQQRVDFRYNNLFDDCAFELADMLISMNEPENAIKYLIRNNQLTATLSDSVHFLNRLYYIGANNEAEQLLEIIRKHCIAEYQRAMSDEGRETGLSNDVPLAHLNSITLSINTDEERSNNEFPHVGKVLMKMFRDESGKSNKYLDNIIHVTTSYRYAYYLFDLDHYISIKQLEEKGLKFDSSWSEAWALTLHQYLSFERHHRIFKRNELLEKAIADLEYFIENYSYGDKYLEFIVSVLIKLSTKTDLVTEVISKLEPIEFNLREENEVDVNASNIYRKQIDFYINGYKNETISKLSVRNNNWEEWTKLYIQILGEIKGCAYRLKHEKKEEELNSLYSKFQSILIRLDFTLDERSKWNNSNLIPEGVYPIIWREIASICLEFYPNKLTNLISIVEVNHEDQFGIYSEGYRECLFNIVDEILIFGSCENFKTEIFKVLQILENHIVKGVENRSERTPLLLRVIDSYARIGHKSKVNTVFDEMLKTTQGPSWYKDGQFSIINKSLRIFASSDNDILKQYASIFDYALGEMTFQRYARAEREDFIGSIVKNWGLATAIDLYKYWTLPEPDIIKRNAERKTIDMPRTGDGYDLGANYINAQSSIISILNSCKDVNPITLWAFSEIFIVGDFRYNNSFAEFQATVLNDFEQRDEGNYGIVYNRLLNIVDKNLSQLRDFYYPDLANSVSEQTYEKLKVSLNELQINLPEKKINEKENNLLIDEMPTDISSYDKLEYYVSAAKKELEIENTDGAISKLLDGFDILQKDNKSIWFRNLTSSLDNAFVLYSEIYQSPESLIYSLKSYILNPNSESWIVASGLLSLLGSKLENLDVIKEIHNYINEHFESIVRQPNKIIERYDWLKPSENTDTNLQLIDLLIWFLNHPHLSLKLRVEEILIWASTMEPELFIPRIVNEALLQKKYISSEICSLIIYELAKSHPEILAKQLDNIDLSVEINHFVIKYNMMQTFFLTRQYSKKLTELYEKLDKSYSNIIQARGSCAYEEPYLLPVQKIIDELDNEYLLDGNICRYIDENINLLCQPLDKLKVVKIDNYIARSFFEEQFDTKRFGNYSYYLKYLINCSISKNVAKPQLETVYELLKSY